DNFVFVMSFFFNIIFYDIIFSVSIIKLKIHLATLLFFYEKSTEVTILNFKNFFLFYFNKYFNNIFFFFFINFYYFIIFSVSIIKLKIHLATLLFFYDKFTEVTILNFKNFFSVYLNEFFNNIFFCCVNNFYDSDFFCVNSKTLSLCSLKSLKFTNSFS